MERGVPPAEGRGKVGLGTIAREWGRIGCLGFGGPPAHILMLRRLCVEQREWLSTDEFEDGIAATNLLPGPASTQLAIFTAWRLRGVAGGLVGGVSFIAPGLVVILLLSWLFLATNPPMWVMGAAAGAGAAVPAVAVQAAAALIPASLARAGGARARWAGYLLAGGVAAVLVGPWLVLVLLAAGLTEVTVRRRGSAALPLLVGSLPAAGGLGALAWVAFKVGALSYGGGFVIIPLMQNDAVHRYHWMTDSQFLSAVALGQVTPGPVVQTVAVVGYAAAGVAGGLLAAVVAFAPSFLIVLLGGAHFDRLRADGRVQDFLTGAAPAVIGAIAGSALQLAGALQYSWQFALLALALLWLLAARRGVVTCLVAAGTLGALVALLGFPPA
jgi:chromate transporter